MYRTSKQQALEIAPGLYCEKRNTKPLSKRPDYLFIVWQPKRGVTGGGMIDPNGNEWTGVGVGYSGGGAWDSALKNLKLL